MENENENDVLTEEDLSIENEEELDESTVEETEETGTTPVEDDTSNALEAKLAELEASNKGLVKSLSAQRNIRQDLQGQLDGIKEAIADVRAKKDATETVDSTGAMIPVDFDDDGNPFLDPANLGSTQNADIEALKVTINQLQNQVNRTVTQKTEQQALNSLLDENEGYHTAHKAVTKAWNFLKDDVFDAYLLERGLEAPKTADQAIDIAMKSKSINAKFTEKYPALDMESVLEAHLIATPRYLRKALNKALVNDTESTNEQLDLSRPSSLAKIDAGGGETQASLLTRVADMSTEDFSKLDERTMAKIDKLLETHG